MAAAAVDTSHLSTFTSVPEATIQTLIDAPTTQLVTSFLQSIIVKAQESDKLKSEQLRLEVELENAIHTSQERARKYKANQSNALKEIETLKTKLNEQETARENLSSQFQDLQSSSATSSTELQTLQAQVSKLEKSNRDTLSLLDAKSTAHDKLAEELASQHQKTTALRREISSLEERSQTAENSLSNAKFRESSLQQEVELLKRNNEWFESELSTKNAEFSKFRKEKNARVAELQRQYEDATSSNDALKRTETTLRKRLDEVQQKADEAFSKIQQLQEDSAKAEESFRAELDNSRRLADLQQQGAESARRRVSELEDSLEQTKEDAANEISQLQSEVETEREAKELAEQRVEQLEADNEKLEAAVSNIHQGRTSVPGTPRLGGMGTPARAGSPAPFSPNSSRVRGGYTITQLYSELTTVKSELESEKRNSESLRSTIDEMIQDLEKREPEVQEQAEENNHLKAEATKLSQLVTNATQDKEAAKKDARKYKGQVDGLHRESELLRQQTRDLSAQVKFLTYEGELRRQGIEPDVTQRRQMQQAATGELEAETLDGMTDTGRFITQEFVTFSNVVELQEQNQKLRAISREIGERLESEEAKEKKAQQDQDRQELESLRERVERYKDEMKSLVTQSESFVRERDMFRRMLAHRGRIPADADMTTMFGQSTNGAATPQTPHRTATPNNEQSPQTRELADYAKLVKDLQSHFDSYRQEAATDHSTLKNQVDTLAKEKNQLQADAAKASSQLSLSHERYEMLQANYGQLKSENEEIQKRSQSLAETAARQDIRTQQVAEELVEAKGLTDSMRSENANLKAERELWKRIEARMTDDNKSLTEERSRLNKALTDSQNLFNERELSDSETRRKLQTRVESLEVEIRDTKRKLEEEGEANKTANQRREYEQDQSRTRIDDLVKSLSNTKEELVAATTTRDQLQARVDELRIELRTSEERVQALQPRSSATVEATSVSTAQVEDDSLSREQELSMEVAELKRNLDLTKAELESAKTQVEQYKAISQSSEEELQSLNETHDQYKEETDRLLAEKDTRIQDLEQRLQNYESELAETNKKLSESTASEREFNTRLEQQRTSHESELAQVKDECERYKETATFHQEDLKAQAEIAQQAQQSYENELLKHAEAAKALQKVRSDYNEIKLEVSQAKADAEAARTTLSQNEESWASTKEYYEREFTELRNRRNDVDAQNRLLHQQLEQVSSQISSLQQSRNAADNNSDDQPLQDSSLRNLQEVIKYLRREKEIVDVQYELSVQESKRLKQQLDYTQSQLDEVRVRLEQERQQQTEKNQSAVSHSKLMETINELNVFRESSVTLRNENRQAQAQLAERQKKIEDLEAQLQPLHASVRELENERETQKGEYELLQRDRDYWNQRAQQILSKYDRVDPAEHEALKEQVSTLQEEKNNFETEKKTLQERVDGIPDEISKAQEEAVKPMREGREKMIEQFKQRSRDLSSKINAGQTERAALTQEIETLRTELETAKTERDDAVARAEAASTSQPAQDQTATITATVEDSEMQNGVEEGQVEEEAQESTTDQTQEGTTDQTQEGTTDQTQEIQTRLLAAEANAEAQATRASQAEAEAEASKQKVVELESQVNELEARLESVNNELSAARNEMQPAGDGESQETLDKLKQDLTAAQQEVESLRNQNSDTTTDVPPATEDQVAQLRAELEAKHSEKEKQLEETYKQRTDNMKKQLNEKLVERKASIREEAKQEYEADIQNLKSEHEASINQLKAEHQAEVERLNTSLQEARSGVQADASNASTDVKPTTPGDFAELSKQQAQTLLQNNATVREVFTRNVKNKIEQETTKIKEEHEKTMNDALAEEKERGERAREQAVTMEGKKWGVKTSMLEGRARNANAKLEIIEKAATDTPERTVADVWAIAKDVKAPPATPAAQPAQIQTSATDGTSQPQQPQTPQTATVDSSNQPPAQTSSRQNSTVENINQVQSPAPTATNPQASQDPQPVSLAGPNTATAASPAAGNASPALDQQQMQTKSLRDMPALSSSTQGQSHGAGVGGAPQSPHSPSVQQNAPVASGNPQNQQQPSGTGPAALRSIVTQGPNISRGGGIPRSANRGNRQGSFSGQSSIPQATQGQGQNSRGGRGGRRESGQANDSQPSGLPQRPPSQAQRGGGNNRGGRGNMNPEANQFQPGGKRQRDDEQGNFGRGAKRPRGQ